ncbi:HIT family hydrolase [Candidatus Nomurabacteria bacterium RIFCSPHIGHO2_02_FULL_41_18]|uniref:HIT family hydrolase n=1 Tax=Candidatus Nomurabacteria bacterium RIFCSPHIGHO2_02_FULL_41_18 TaxID=1801754 RepID=A0A1F6W4T2_9BACT|nr:MAG: HIT family hydrolase [Candidatus Nomurabacteria bacterium RIFCSPHIGHO2_01_FULL_41_71]OGI76947.1 MAG: HIT family hydrolase [Candidatus Nomurabacteria bacterium RIFCSPHIGHO2_02_FULL_41_18]OGI89457.1 MAG: HIT family hydrolase [Candidatus Nomurabacteria bacterium RIFCSPLOWO2_01_FULL_41_52b]
MDNNCIFCKIVRGEIPSAKIYEDDKTLAFLDIVPVNIGHALVIPKEHFKDIHEVPEDLVGHMMKIVKKVSSALRTSLPCDGVNVNMNNEGAAGQVVFHAHIHVIPRHAGDGFELWHGKRKYQENEMQKVSRKVSLAIA